MLKKLLMLFVALSLSLAAGLAAAVEVNTADQAALESVKGLGPVKSKAIIDERIANAPNECGLLLVLTGNGKGKSSSAFGMLARALGHGLQCGVVQFIKAATAPAKSCSSGASPSRCATT